MSAVKGHTALAINRVWHHTSARERVLGTLANRIAYVLMGKHKPTYEPSVDAGDYVVVEHALDIRLSGKKGTEKVYYSHTGYPGGLKKMPITRLKERYPEEIIKRAVSGMLPKNSFRVERLARLKVFPGAAPAPYMANVLRTWRNTVPQEPAAATTSTPSSTQAPATPTPSP